MPKHNDHKQFIQTGSEAILEAIGDAISIQDKNLKIIYQNKAHVSMMGNHLGEYCYTAYQSKHEPCHGCHLLESFKDGKAHRRQTSGEITGCGKIHVEIVSTPLRDAQGEIIGGIESVRDVTERVMMEEKLTKQLAAIETSMDGIAILNSEGEYVYLNQAHAAVYGYNAPEELIGRMWHCLYDSEELERFQKEIMPLLMEKGSWRGEATGMRNDGTFFPQELSLTVTEDNGIVCVVRDVSDRKESESRLKILNLDLEKRARDLMIVNQELESFSYTVSHDLRKPLTVIKGYCNMIQELCGHDIKNQCREFLQAICDGADSMNRLIDTLLTFSRLSRTEISRKTIDLSTIANTVAAELALTDTGRRVTFRIAESITANADTNLLRVVLENLLGNAWKYTSNTKEAVIEFGAMEAEGRQTYFVRDNGVGFDMTQADKLFTPFQRLHGTDAEGHGIGLATVERIVKRHGGNVWAEGEPGKGATFYFTL